MKTYQFTAKNSEGVVLTSTIQAGNEEHAVEILYRNGFFISKISEVKIKYGNENFFSKFLSVGTNDLIVFCRQFRLLFRAGVTIVEILNILEEQTINPKLKKALCEIKKKVKAGDTFSGALRQHPSVFPSTFCGLIEVGEMSGTLEKTFERLTSYLEKSQTLKQDVTAALTYPVAVTVISIFIIGFVITYVVPEFNRLFSKFGNFELPIITKLLVIFSTAIRTYWYLGIICGIFLFVLFAWLWKKENFRRKFDIIIFKIPILGNLLREIHIANFMRTFATLIGSGITLTASVEIAKKTVNNYLLYDMLDKLDKSVKEGRQVAASLSENWFFPPLALKMIAVGEESGNMDEMLCNASEYFEEKIQTLVKSLTSIIEPILVVFIGLIIGTVVIALYMPVFEFIKML